MGGTATNAASVELWRASAATMLSVEQRGDKLRQARRAAVNLGREKCGTRGAKGDASWWQQRAHTAAAACLQVVGSDDCCSDERAVDFRPSELQHAHPDSSMHRGEQSRPMVCLMYYNSSLGS